MDYHVANLILIITQATIGATDSYILVELTATLVGNNYFNREITCSNAYSLDLNFGTYGDVFDGLEAVAIELCVNIILAGKCEERGICEQLAGYIDIAQIGQRGNAQRTFPAIWLRYLHQFHGFREITSRAHAVPKLVQILL